MSKSWWCAVRLRRQSAVVESPPRAPAYTSEAPTVVGGVQCSGAEAGQVFGVVQSDDFLDAKFTALTMASGCGALGEGSTLSSGGTPYRNPLHMVVI